MGNECNFAYVAVCLAHDPAHHMCIRQWEEKVFGGKAEGVE